MRAPFSRLSWFVIVLTWSQWCLAVVEPKIIFEHDPTLLVTTLEVIVTTGSADEAPGKNGVTHLLAELMLRGTKKRSRTKFQTEIERLGAGLGVHTTHDLIGFSGKVIKENTEPFLKLVEDALLHPKFDKKEFQSLKAETLAELANRKNQNSRLAGLALRQIMFAGTPLEKSTEGSLSTVKAITLDEVQKSYNDRIHRGNVIFAVASPLKEEVIKKALTAIWLQFPDGNRRTPSSIAPKLPEKTTLVVINKPSTSTGSLVFGQPGITAQDADRYTLGVGNFGFGSEPLISRLFRIIRSEKAWTYQVGSTYHAMGNLSYQQGLFLMSSTPSVEFTAKTMLKMLSMWEDYYKAGLKPEEIKLAVESQINSYPFEFESAEKRLGQKVQSYLYNVPVLSPEEYAKTLSAVDNNKLKKALKERQNPNRWVITLVADAKTIQKQLDEEQKNVPEAQRIKIDKVLTPDQVVQ